MHNISVAATIVLLLVLLLSAGSAQQSKAYKVEPIIDHCSKYCQHTRPHLSAKSCFIMCAYGHQNYNGTTLNLFYNNHRVESGTEMIDDEKFPVKKFHALTRFVTKCDMNKRNCRSVVRVAGRDVTNWKFNEFETEKLKFANVRDFIVFDRLFIGFDKLISESSWRKLFEKYGETEKMHIFTDPVPSNLDDLMDYHLIRAIVDIVPRDAILFKEGPKSFSDGYTTFLLNVKVDASEMKPVERDPVIEKQINETVEEFKVQSEICFEEFKEYAEKTKTGTMMEDIKKYVQEEGHCTAMKLLEKKLVELHDKTKELTKVDVVTSFFEQVGKNAMAFVKPFSFELDKLIALNETKRTNEQINLKLQPSNSDHKYLATGLKTVTNLRLNIGKWTDVEVKPGESWFSQKVIDTFRDYPLRDRKGNEQLKIFGEGGVLERRVSRILVASDVTATFQIGPDLRDDIMLIHSMSKLRPLEVGPFVFDEMTMQDDDSGDTTTVILKTSDIQPFALTSVVV